MHYGRGSGLFQEIKEIIFIFPFIADARDVEQLSKNNITHILSIHDSARPMLEVRGAGDFMVNSLQLTVTVILGLISCSAQLVF